MTNSVSCRPPQSSQPTPPAATTIWRARRTDAGHDDAEPSSQAGKPAPHRPGRDHDADQADQQHARQRRADEHQHRDHEQHQGPEATQTGPHRGGRSTARRRGRGPAGIRGRHRRDHPGAEPQRGGQHVGGGPGAPELVGRELSDHEQPQVAPHDLPVGGDEEEPQAPVGRPGQEQPEHDREGGIDRRAGQVLPHPSTPRDDGGRGLEGRRHRSTSCKRRFTTLAMIEITIEITRYIVMRSRTIWGAGLAWEMSTRVIAASSA